MIQSIDSLISKILDRTQQPRPERAKIMDLWCGFRKVEWPTEVHQTIYAVGRIYRSDWIADCPFCHNAMLISVADPKFYCSNEKCDNGGISGAAGSVMRVVLPSPQGVMRIEAVLSLRPNPMNRNWWPGERLQTLIRENKEHGIGLENIGKAVARLERRWLLMFDAEEVEKIKAVDLAQELA